jgi:ubiquinone/menaquinone biosynthesis C-methylase UbiE
MPTVEENARTWDGWYDWSERGDEWSGPWGGVEMQWQASVLPRIHSFLPAGTILEIAPGCGRWTQYLKDFCGKLIAVDLSKRCIDTCHRRFAGCRELSFHVNDGKSLAMVPDCSIDFCFSFDSLVHTEVDVIRAYVDQLASKLKPQGVAFLHHSNLGQYRRYFAVVRRVGPLRLVLRKLGAETNLAWRALSMTSEKLRELAEAAGLVTIRQELVNWRSRRLIDCFSTVTPKGSAWERPLTMLKNYGFMNEARHVRRLSLLYADRRAA